NPATSNTFTFWQAWRGSRKADADGVAAINEIENPDNLMIDQQGGVWFGTDGNFSGNDTADALYYLDLDPAHKTTAVVTYGMPFRVIAGPSDSEATGPAFNADMSTIFFNVQHPGEREVSTWPPR
ncbi:MAG: alkaline phosphatase PhoX, partial [Pseudomonadota bacterium]